MQFLLIISFLCINFVTGSYWHPKQIPYVGDYIKKSVNEINFCTKNICITDSSRMAMWMNYTANPCDGIYRYVCGSMLRYVS